MKELGSSKWVVYAKRPFAGPQQVLGYLSWYTHRVAISNQRLLAWDEQSVTFADKDYADGQRRKTMTLNIQEFVRRFCLHLLPERFVKIRHYGLLGNRDRGQRLERALGVKREQPLEPVAGKEPSETEETVRLRCPHCGALALVWIKELPRSRPNFKPVAICDSS